MVGRYDGYTEEICEPAEILLQCQNREELVIKGCNEKKCCNQHIICIFSGIESGWPNRI